VDWGLGRKHGLAVQRSELATVLYTSLCMLPCIWNGKGRGRSGTSDHGECSPRSKTGQGRGK